MTPEQKAREEAAEKELFPCDPKRRDIQMAKVYFAKGWDAHAAWAKAEIEQMKAAYHLCHEAHTKECEQSNGLRIEVEHLKKIIDHKNSSSGKSLLEKSGEAGKFPRRIWIGESCDEWGLSPGPNSSGEPYVSLEEHEALLLAGRASLREEMEDWEQKADNAMNLNESLRAEMEAMDMAMATQGVDYGAAQERKDSEIAQLLASIKGMKEGICVTCDQLAAKTRECEKLREALEEACEELHIQFDVIENLKIHECLPTEDELQQAMQAKNAAREALRPDSAKEDKA